jgi:hypothetical protein
MIGLSCLRASNTALISSSEDPVSRRLRGGLVDADEREGLDEVAAEGPLVGSPHEGKRSIGDNWLHLSERLRPFPDLGARDLGGQATADCWNDLDVHKAAVMRRRRGGTEPPAAARVNQVCLAELLHGEAVGSHEASVSRPGRQALPAWVLAELDLGLQPGGQVTRLRQCERRIGAEVDALLLLRPTALHAVEQREDPPPARKDADGEAGE